MTHINQTQLDRYEYGQMDVDEEIAFFQSIYNNLPEVIDQMSLSFQDKLYNLIAEGEINV